MATSTVDISTIIASGARVLTIKMPPDMTKIKSYSGAKFVPVDLKAPAIGNKAFSFMIAGQREPLNIPIIFGAPTKENAKNGPTAKRVSVCLSLADCGDLGKAIDIIQRDFMEQATANARTLWPKSTPMNPSGPIKRTYGPETEKKDSNGESLAGKPREPIVSLNIDFGNFPSTYIKAFANKPRTMIYDWRTRSVDEHGKEKFDELKSPEGQGLSLESAHEIVKSGDIVRRIVLATDSVTISKQGVSLRMRIYKLWLDSASESDVNIIDDTATAPASMTLADVHAPSSSQAATSAGSEPHSDNDEVDIIDEASDDDIIPAPEPVGKGKKSRK